MSLQLVPVDAQDFQYDDWGTLKATVSHEFETDILVASAALQGWGVSYEEEHNHNFHKAAAEIGDIVVTGNKITCKVTLHLDNRTDEQISTYFSKARVLFIADCEN
uniref:Uncharacterized protein n=1 Tax=Pseudobryopsis hainanensis TaxID=2320808 RepID=A0A386AXV8_9CHLO|nr:hypothetical protein [Pseudobryopsis hainanensis]